jgi:hypothetical protein
MWQGSKNWKLNALLLVACVATCSGLAGAQTWSNPQFIANGFGIAVATNGTTSAALFMPPSGGLQASVKTGGTWSTPVTLSSLGPFGVGTGNIAVAPNGDVLAVWSFRTTNTYITNQAQAAFFSGGRWGSPITISNNVYGNVNSFGLPGIGFDSHSQATLIDEEITNSSPIACALKARTGSAASGFGSAQIISNATTCYGLAKLAVNSGAEAVAVEGATGILTGAVVAISRSLTGTWGTPVTVAASAYRQNNPNVGLGNEGTAVVVWRTRSGVSYAVRSGGTWSAAAPLPVLAGQAGGSTGVAVDGPGNAVDLHTSDDQSWDVRNLSTGRRVVADQGATEFRCAGGCDSRGNVCGLGNDGVDAVGRDLELDHAYVRRHCDGERGTGIGDCGRRPAGQCFDGGGPVGGAV